MLVTAALIWPLAVGSALSPSITAVVLALVVKNGGRRRRAIWFWWGAMAAMLIWAIIVSSFVWSIVLNATHQYQESEHYIDLVLGIALICVGAIRFLHKPPPSGTTGKSSRLQGLDSGSFRRQFAFGAIMQGRNITSIILFCAAQQHIDDAPIPLWQQLILTAGLIGITTSSSWIVITLPATALARLNEWAEPTYGWLGRNAKAIEVIAAVGFGTYLVVRSILAVVLTGA